MGLESAKRAVRALREAGASLHAVLLYGMPGSGKSELADILAQSWVCTNGENRGCGECRACQSWSRHANADVLSIRPAGLSNNIRLSAISPADPEGGEAPPLSLQEFLRTMPLMSAYKVAIIHDADRLLPRAANALLKTLEEPQPYGKLILTSSSVGQVLPTILSRCVAIACELPQEGAATADPLVWRFAEGSPGRAAEIEPQRDLYEAIDRFANRLSARRPGEALVASDELRELAERLEAKRGCGMRLAYASVLEALALALERGDSVRPEAVKMIAEAHRRVIGNGSASLALDALFAGLMLETVR